MNFFREFCTTLCFGSCLLLFSCSGNSKSDKNQNNETQGHSNMSLGNWILINEKDSIPLPLSKAYSDYFNIALDIANPEEPFNATDNIIDSLPTKRLSLLARRGTEWRLAFLQGGFAKHYMLIQCNVMGDSTSNLFIAKTYRILDNNDTISNLIATKELQQFGKSGQ